MKTLVIIPTYNECENIAKIIKTVLQVESFVGRVASIDRELVNFKECTGSITFAEWDILDSTNSIFAMEYVNADIYNSSVSAFYFLAHDISGVIKLLKTDDFTLEDFSIVVDTVDSALGLGWDNHCTLYFSYPDRRISEGKNICE